MALYDTAQKEWKKISEIDKEMAKREQAKKMGMLIAGQSLRPLHENSIWSKPLQEPMPAKPRKVQEWKAGVADSFELPNKQQEQKESWNKALKEQRDEQAKSKKTLITEHKQIPSLLPLPNASLNKSQVKPCKPATRKPGKKFDDFTEQKAETPGVLKKLGMERLGRSLGKFFGSRQVTKNPQSEFSLPEEASAQSEQKTFRGPG